MQLIQIIFVLLTEYHSVIAKKRKRKKVAAVLLTF